MDSGQDESVRTVQDAEGRFWHVYPVIETGKLGAIRRGNWLCLESGPDRRFISPVPPEWRNWTDAVLLHRIDIAKPDLRGD